MEIKLEFVDSRRIRQRSCSSRRCLATKYLGRLTAGRCCCCGLVLVGECMVSIDRARFVAATQ